MSVCEAFRTSVSPNPALHLRPGNASTQSPLTEGFPGVAEPVQVTVCDDCWFARAEAVVER